MQKLAWSLTENTPNIVLNDSTTGVESVVVSYQIPRLCALAIPKGSQFTIDLYTSTPAQITSGTIRAYKVDPSGAKRTKFLEAPIGKVNQLVGGSEDVYKLKIGIAFNSDEILQITYEGTDVADADGTVLFVEGVLVTP